MLSSERRSAMTAAHHMSAAGHDGPCGSSGAALLHRERLDEVVVGALLDPSPFRVPDEADASGPWIFFVNLRCCRSRPASGVCARGRVMRALVFDSAEGVAC